MKIGRIRSYWIMCSLCFYTMVVCLRSVFKYYFSRPTRAWVDKTIHHWVNQLLNAVHVQYKIINPLNIRPQPKRATILMCNHSSAFDIPLSFKVFPNHSIRMLAKSELSKIPLLSKGMKAAEFPFIDRKNRYQAVKDLAVAQQLMESGIILWVAPEGTRSKNGKLAPFKKGAFITAIQAGAVIIPVGIRGAFDILPPGSSNIRLCQQAEIIIGQPLDAARFTLENKEELISRTYNTIKALIGE
ncbi:MAG: 1-acyl-sn-glycerol-3-phosphate acyltransferase [Legionella sp.]|nr:1-acyl-sn-glycerol-3-phosphate acyltransferase [Legionella sp.]